VDGKRILVFELPLKYGSSSSLGATTVMLFPEMFKTSLWDGDKSNNRVGFELLQDEAE
jgi:hypothetical protein